MKVVQIIPYLGLAGAEVMCTSLALELHKNGHDVTVVSLYNKQSSLTQSLEKHGIQVIYLNKKLGLDLSMIPFLTKIFKELKPDIVHSHLDTLKYVSVAASLAHIKVRVHTVHNVAQKEAVGLAMKMNNFAYKHLKVIPVALSEEVQDTIIDYYGLNKSQIPVIFNGVDLSLCHEKTNYELKDNTLHLVNVARFSKQKNQAMLVYVIKQMKDHGDRVHLTFVGEGKLMESVKSLVDKENLNEEITFAGQQDDVHPFLEAADAFVLCSHYEGMPMSIIEAMGTGLPIVSTNVGGIPTMIENNVDGLLVDESVDEMVKALEKLLNKDVCIQFGKRCVKIANEKFSAKAMATSYVKLYISLL